MVEVMKKVSERYEENVKAVRKVFPGALVLDVTLGGAMMKMDPGYPIGGVEIPGKFRKGLSVNGVWEGLKVFEKKDGIDERWMVDERKVGKVRGCKSWGKLMGIRVREEVIGEEDGKELMRELYEGLMKERFGRVLEGIRKEAEKRVVVLLDYKDESDRPFNHVEVLKELIVA